MDILAHGLWAGALAHAWNRRKKQYQPKVNPVRTAFWSIFPDLLAFTPISVWFIWGILSGEVTFDTLPRHNQLEPASPDTIPMMRFTNLIYSFSHSLIIFGLVVLVLFLVRRFLNKERPWYELISWEMGGWLLHVLIDIPTHSYAYFPTPLLWPLSTWKFPYGFDWAVPSFVLLNYGALAYVYLRFYLEDKRGRLKAVV